MLFIKHTTPACSSTRFPVLVGVLVSPRVIVIKETKLLKIILFDSYRQPVITYCISASEAAKALAMSSHHTGHVHAPICPGANRHATQAGRIVSLMHNAGCGSRIHESMIKVFFQAEHIRSGRQAHTDSLLEQTRIHRGFISTPKQAIKRHACVHTYCQQCVGVDERP